MEIPPMSRSLSVQIAYQLRISSFDGKRRITTYSGLVIDTLIYGLSL
jgi:hypothetical protein